MIGSGETNLQISRFAKSLYENPLFFDLSGIANYAETADKTSVSFVYNGNITAIIDKLHLLHLDDVLLEEPSLEEIFMHYYA